MALKLAKAGYWGGNPEAVKHAPLDAVLDAVEYEDFCYDYEGAQMEIIRATAGS